MGVHVYLGDSDSGDQGEEEMAMLPYSRNVVSSSDRSYDTTALVSEIDVLQADQLLTRLRHALRLAGS